MSDSYLNAPQTRMLATHCCVCGRALCDAISVELGIGPECRDGMTGGITPEQRSVCNQLTWAASRFATAGRIKDVRRCAHAIREAGLTALASRIEERFIDAEERATITIESSGDQFIVNTPYRRGDADAFKQAWRAIPGRRWDPQLKVNRVPKAEKAALWALLVRFFPGEYGMGPEGVFLVPREGS